MNANEPISTIMSKKVIVANQFHNFSQVLKLFSEFPIHHLPIVDGKNHILGIISSNDVMRLFLNPKYQDLKLNLDELDKAINLSDIMTPNPVTVEPTETIQNVARILAQQRFQAMPVTKDGEVVGIVSVKDIAELVATD